MPKLSKRKSQARKASQASVDARKATRHSKQIHDINQLLKQMNDGELQLIYQNIVQLISQTIVQSASQGIVQSTSNETTNQIMLRQKLINMVEQLRDDQLKVAVHLFDTMWYSKGPNEEKIP
ncbi:8785_t:CDS:1 [Cetraspora pellucida]|uniref:8785_t:CDS:1 n=1 Tax=Cetraspora pellucida TaxID=1433469 RepID=A0A9N9I646_9GLOM|nr:8785_t:CDS:1 [Cetraspora pellucida]